MPLLGLKSISLPIATFAKHDFTNQYKIEEILHQLFTRFPDHYSPGMINGMPSCQADAEDFWGIMLRGCSTVF